MSQLHYSPKAAATIRRAYAMLAGIAAPTHRALADLQRAADTLATDPDCDPITAQALVVRTAAAAGHLRISDLFGISTALRDAAVIGAELHRTHSETQAWRSFSDAAKAAQIEHQAALTAHLRNLRFHNNRPTE